MDLKAQTWKGFLGFDMVDVNDINTPYGIMTEWKVVKMGGAAGLRLAAKESRSLTQCL